MGMTLAERSFNQKVDEGLQTRDFEQIEQAFYQYGTYLELVGGDAPAEALVRIEMTHVLKEKIEPHPHPEDIIYEAWCEENELNPVHDHLDAFWAEQAMDDTMPVNRIFE